jgi:putative Holliday junction resolvase
MGKTGRIMALDVGDSRIGVAMSDPLRILASPHSTITRNKHSSKLLLELCRSEQVQVIVIGLPINMQGQIDSQAQKTIEFKEKLADAARNQNLSLEFVMWDERLTSVSAERMIQGSKLRDKNRRALLDQVSATLILESYMNSLSHAS